MFLMDTPTGNLHVSVGCKSVAQLYTSHEPAEVPESEQDSSPAVHQTGVGEWAIAEANCQVQKGVVGKNQSGKWKCYTTYTDEDRVQIGQYAAENGNAKAMKQFKLDFHYLSESTALL